jgi:hypothetical protein
MEGDIVWVEIAEGVEVRVAKGAISRRVPPAADAAAEAPAIDAPASDTTPEITEGTDPARPTDDEQ